MGTYDVGIPAAPPAVADAPTPLLPTDGVLARLRSGLPEFTRALQRVAEVGAPPRPGCPASAGRGASRATPTSGSASPAKPAGRPAPAAGPTTSAGRSS